MLAITEQVALRRCIKCTKSFCDALTDSSYPLETIADAAVMLSMIVKEDHLKSGVLNLCGDNPSVQLNIEVHIVNSCFSKY